MNPTQKKITARDWYNKKANLYRDLTGTDWSFVDPYSSHPMASECFETMMRMAYEKAYFGFTTSQEDIEIANAIMIRDRT
jgi:hypothetical protein